MQINPNPGYSPLLGGDPSIYTINKTDAAFAAMFKTSDDPKDMLAEIAGNGVEGMMKWKVKELQKQIAEKVLASKDVTLEEIAAMPPKQRVALEQQIMREVAEKLKQAIHEQMKREGTAGLDMYDAGQPLDITA